MWLSGMQQPLMQQVWWGVLGMLAADLQVPRCFGLPGGGSRCHQVMDKLKARMSSAAPAAAAVVVGVDVSASVQGLPGQHMAPMQQLELAGVIGADAAQQAQQTMSGMVGGPMGGEHARRRGPHRHPSQTGVVSNVWQGL